MGLADEVRMVAAKAQWKYERTASVAAFTSIRRECEGQGVLETADTHFITRKVALGVKGEPDLYGKLEGEGVAQAMAMLARNESLEKA